ncbi:MAG: NUDIX hydrolase [Patescibacteria group bacterium]|nr:NUDIX hydrolase [Patescibacteria group bacterium]
MSKVVVGIIVKKESPESYLLVSSNTDFGKYTGYYYPPGGHVEDGESEVDALKREIKEELAIDLLKVEKITDEIESDIKDQKTIWYLCEVENHNFKFDKEELKDARFFTRKEMEEINLWPATKTFFEKYIFKNNQ